MISADSTDLENQERCVEAFQKVRQGLHANIVGMDSIIDALFWTLLCRGHAVFIGVPGLAKTLLISTLSKLIGLHFNRVQFTPDLMPSDLIGTEVLEEDRATGKKNFEFRKGPLFCQLLLADEINRTPPKTQSALLQAMQERKVSYAGTTFDLQEPFTVFATQNPIESEGTYPLPEAQLDRFLFSIPIEYPSAEDEVEIVKRTTGAEASDLKPVMSSDELVSFQKLVRKVPLEDVLVEKIVSLVRATRPSESMPADLKEMIRFGAGPRASQAISMGAKARALLDKRFAVREEDILAVAPFVIDHRVVYRRLQKGSSQDLVERLISLGA